MKSCKVEPILEALSSDVVHWYFGVTGFEAKQAESKGREARHILLVVTNWNDYP